MTKRGLVPVAVAACLVFSAAASAGSLMPRVSYDRQVRFVGGEPVVLHVVRTPKHGRLFKLRPVLSHGTVLGRQTVPSMQRDLARRATTVGVNGDFFRLENGTPSGVFMRDGVLATKPNRGRSALGIAFDGTLHVRMLRFSGSWQAEGFEPHRVHDVNRAILDPPAVALYTPEWGGPTPRFRAAVEAVLEGFPNALPNGSLTGTVTRVGRGGGTWIPPGGAVLQARGEWRRVLRDEAQPGTPLTVRLDMPNLPVDVADAIGGGPLLVRGGRPVRQTDEWFTLAQLVPRHPRAAVGQLPNGRILLVVADGRSRTSFGLTNAALANVMASLGAQRAMALDGGGSATLAVDGRVLNRPADGAPRAVPNGLFVHYYGIYAPPAPRSPLSPNGDGVRDSGVVSAKVVRRSEVDLRLLRPNGSVAWRHRDTARRARIRHEVGKPGMANGTWRWVVEATEVRSGRRTSMERRFVVNRTLGHLRLSTQRLRVAKRRGGRLGVSVEVTRRAAVTVTVRKASGRTVRRLHRGTVAPGRRAWRWSGRNASGGLVREGRYAVVVRASNGIGTVRLERGLRVVRVRRG